MWFAAVYFSYFFHDDTIASYWMVFLNVFQSNIFAAETEL